MPDINPKEYCNSQTFITFCNILSNGQCTYHELRVEIAMFERLAKIGRTALLASRFYMGD